MRLKPINQQVVVVMGASSGIGRATALRFAEKGAKVVVSARNEVGLATLVDEITSKGGVAIAVAAEVADPAQVQRVADLAVAQFGRIDTWAHLSASSIYATFEQTRPIEFARIVEVNLLGQVHGALAALPYMRREGRGALIHVSSVEGLVSLPFQSAYAASKHGVVGFLDSLRLELQREGTGISVTNIMPSTINTPLFQKAITRLGVEPRGTAPLYQPQVVADAIVRAATHPVRDVVVGAGGMALVLAWRLSPSLSDAVLRTQIGFEAQETCLPKSADAPNDVFAPTQDEYLKTEGQYSDEAKTTSLPTRIETSAVVRGMRTAARLGYRVAARVLEAGWALSLPRLARRRAVGLGVWQRVAQSVAAAMR